MPPRLSTCGIVPRVNTMKKFTFFAAVILAALFALSPRALFSHETITTTVTFDREISRIFRKKCVECHNEKSLSVPLTSYEEARPWARAIEEEVLARRMPPWHAVQGYGQFANDLGLTNREIQFIVSWVEGNGPKSKDQQLIENFGEAPPATQTKEDEKWGLGTPDIVKALPAESVAPSGAPDRVRRVRVDLGFSTAKWVRALEFQPEDRRALRAAFFSIEETGQWLGSWTPWYGVTTLPRDMAYRIPGGSHVLVELHYQSSNEPFSDGGSLGLYFAEKPASHHPDDLTIEALGDGSSATATQKLTGSARIAANSGILALRPEMQQGIDSLEVSAAKPDGTIEVLLLVRNAEPAWPTPYILKQSVPLPKNSEIRVTAYAHGEKPLSKFRLTVSLYENAEPAHPTTVRQAKVAR